MNIRPRAGETRWRCGSPSIPQLRPVSQEPISCHGDAYARVRRWWASARPRSILLLPIDQRRRDEIPAAVAAYDAASDEPLPRNAARLLTVMFLAEDVCRRSLETIVAEGFNRNTLPAMLRRLEAAGFLSRQRGAA